MLQRVTRPPTILVTDCGRGSAISILRSLGRRGARVVAADAARRSLGARSRFAQAAVRYPAPDDAPAAFVDAILQAAIDHEVDLVIPVTDAAILPLSAARERFHNVCRLAIPAAEALAAAADKYRTVVAARRLGVPVPRTQLVTTVAESLALGDSLGWPIVLKPQVSRLLHAGAAIDSFKVGYAENQSALAERMARFENRCPVLLQEYYPGQGYGVELLVHAGRPLAAFQHLRLRELPVNGGPSSFRTSVPLDPQMYRHSVQLLEDLNWTGLAMVEFKLGAQGPRLMEINGRVWGSLPLAVHSGMDFPGRLADLWLHGPPPDSAPVNTSYRVGVRSRNLELDLMWIVSVLLGRNRFPFLPAPPRRQALQALAGLFNPRARFDILSLADPGPGLAEMWKIVGKFVHKARTAD